MPHLPFRFDISLASTAIRVRIWLVLVLLFIGLGMGIPALMPAPQQITRAQDDPPAEDTTPLIVLNEENIKQATVLIMQAFDSGRGSVISCVGSGTLVTSDGLILTNYHNVVASNDCRADDIIIAITLRTDEPPVPTYIAEIIEQSQGLDIAVLQITRYIDGRLIESGTLQLPFVELGESEQLRLDDTLWFFGYPNIGNEGVTVIQGALNGFTAEARAGNQAWLRTTAEIPGLMSGGGAYNRAGQLIGVPTITPERISGSAINCRRIYDTDANNQIDNTDACIPVGGNISAIRPLQLVQGLIRAATLGIRPGPERSPNRQPARTELPALRRPFVTTGVTAEGMPINVVTSAPQGTSSLYLFFDYNNMEDGFVYELRTTIDGRPSLLYSLPPVTWSGGREGMWYIGSTGIPYPNGVYQFSLYVEGRQLANHSIVVGGAPRNIPQFSDIVFGIEDPNGNLIGTNYVIPEGNIIRARFNYRNMQENLNWQHRWYSGNSPTPFYEEALAPWAEGEQGTSSNVGIRSESGFPSGRYRMELWLQLEEAAELTLAATADFIVAGGAGGVNDAQALIFSDFRFAQREENALPINSTDGTFNAESPSIYVFFNWRQLSPGTPYAWRWLVDGDVLIETYTNWAVDANGINYFFSLLGSPALPDATYTFEIELGGIRIEQVQARVGLGQLPLETFADAEGIQLAGYIRDAETKQGIPGGLFIVLLSEFSVEDFTWEASQILGRAKADRNGFFQIPVLLPRGTLEEPILYSMLVRADGYLPINTDGIIVTAERSPLEIIVEMNRD